MLLQALCAMDLSMPDLDGFPSWAWVALGLVLGVLLAPGIAAYDARRRRKPRVPRSRPQIPTRLKSRIDELEDNLSASEAARDSLERQLDDAEELALERLRLLESVAEVSLPGLESMSRSLQDMMESAGGGSTDRRRSLGPIGREIHELSVLVREFLALGRVEGHGSAPRSEMVELRKEMQRALAGHSALVFHVEDGVPSLVLSDRALLAVVFEKLARASDGAQGAVPLIVSAEMIRTGLFAVDLSYEGLPEFPASIREHFVRGELQHVPSDLVTGGRETLSLAVAGRAIARLGGQVHLESREDRRESLRVEFVFAAVEDRRSCSADESSLTSVRTDERA